MIYGPMNPEKIDLVAASSAGPGYYFRPEGPLLITKSRSGAVWLPMVGESAFKGMRSLQGIQLIRVHTPRVDVSFGDPVPYSSDHTWGIGHLVIPESGQVGLAVMIQPSPGGEWERVLVDVTTGVLLHPDSRDANWAWFADWELQVVDGDRRATLAVSPPPKPKYSVSII